MTRRFLIQITAIAAALALAAPAGAQFTENALGPITATDSSVRIHSSTIGGPRWFGLRVFTVPAGTMRSHNVLMTSRTTSTNGQQLSYTGGPTAGNKVLCVSDFQGNGSPDGGLFGNPASGFVGPADNLISMVGGFIGTATDCKDTSGSRDIEVTMNTTGPIVQAFYGAFYGDSAADWRSTAGQVSGNTAWWNLWGNFTALGYGASG